MGIDLRLPNIKGATEKERLSQLESYMRQFVEQLQWALNSLETASAHGAMAPKTTSKAVAQTGEKAVDANATFNAIKHLIIKSADIVTAYYEEINKKLVGEYVAQSDFGTFKEYTEQNIDANSKGIEQSFSNTQTIESDLESVNSALSDSIASVANKAASDLESVTSSLGDSIDVIRKDVGAIDSYVSTVEAHIRSGELEQVNGVPVYGIEVGQRNTINGEEQFSAYARFTSSKLSFYNQSGFEVAYISDRQLYISNVCVLVSYKIGGIMDIVQPNGDVVTLWVGIGGDA